MDESAENPSEPEGQQESQQESQPEQTESQQNPQNSKFQEAIQNLFGDSDDDDDLGQVKDVVFDSDSDGVELPSFKKAARNDDDDGYQPVTRKRKSEIQKQRQEEKKKKRLEAAESQKTEAEKDIDSILSRLKPTRARSGMDLQNEVQVDQVINALVDSMRQAAISDQDFNKAGQPAIAKLKLLPSAMEHLSKASWFPQFLDANVLECIKYWLEPLGDGSLPSLDIQQSMLGVIEKMPVETHHLRTSLIGRVLMFYTKSERVSPAIKRAAQSLVNRWMRPILGKSSDHKHKKLREARYDAPKQRQSRNFKMSKPGEFERPNMASIPQKIAANFNVVPVSAYGNMTREQMQAANPQSQEKKVDKYRKMKNVMRSSKSRNPNLLKVLFLPAGDTTVLKVDETTSVADIIKMVEDKKQMSMMGHSHYITCPDGKRIQDLIEETTIGNFKQMDKFVFGIFVDIILEIKAASPTPSVAVRRSQDVLSGLTVKGLGSSGSLDSPSLKARFTSLKSKSLLFKKLGKEDETGSSRSSLTSRPAAGSPEKPNFVEAKGSMMGTAQKAAQLMEKKSGKPRHAGLGHTSSNADFSETSSFNMPYTDSAEDLSGVSHSSIKPSNLNMVTSFTSGSDDTGSISAAPKSYQSRQSQSGTKHERDGSRLDRDDDVSSILEATGLSDDVEENEQQMLETQEAVKLFLQKYGPDKGFKWKPSSNMLKMGDAFSPASNLSIDSPDSSASSPSQIPYYQRFVVFNLNVSGEVPTQYKVLKTSKLESFLKTFCTKRGLEYDSHSFEYGDPSTPRPAEMDLTFQKFTLPLELYLVKKAKVYSSISTNEDDEEVVISNIVEGKPVIMACKKEKILSIITDPTYDDEKFTNIIFLTFRNFCTAEEMLAHLLYTFYAKLDSKASENDVELFQKYRVPTQLKIIKVLHNWIEHHWHDFGLDSTLRSTLNSFLYILTSTPDGEFVEVARGLVFVVDIQRRWFEDLLNTYTHGERKVKKIDSMLERVEVDELAEQLCIHDGDIFRNIHPIEFLNEIWRKPGDENTQASPSFKFFVERFDKESYWVATELLACSDPKKRIKTLVKFINLVKRCAELNNFFSTFSLISGLNLIPVQRLKTTWEQLPEKARQVWTEVEKIADPSKNMKNYRDRLQNATPPMVPFLPIYLKDLTFINDGNPSKVKGLINVDKLRSMANRVQEIVQLGNTLFPFDRKPAVLNYLEKPSIEMNLNKLKEIAAKLEADHNMS